MSYRTSVYITCHKGMVGSLGSIPLLPKTNSNVVPENVIFSKTSCIAKKLPKQFFAANKLLNC